MIHRAGETRETAGASSATSPSTPARAPSLDSQTLASSLTPMLEASCEGRLRNLRWFRADWQRGGAATAHAEFTDDQNQTHRVIVKLPVGASELTWTRRLQCGEQHPVIPRLHASGDAVGGFDLAWIVIEALPHGPLGARWQDSSILRIAEAAARFHHAASTFIIDRVPVQEDWTALLKAARDSVQTNHLAEKSRWTAALKTLAARLDALVREWNHRAMDTWVHGDLHPANAMCRHSNDNAEVVLIDLAEVRPGHWIEDAVFLERLFWAHPDHIKIHKPVRAIGDARKRLGLPVNDDDRRLAAIRRALLAATAPKFMKTEGNPAHLAACLNRLEASLLELAAATPRS